MRGWKSCEKMKYDPYWLLSLILLIDTMYKLVPPPDGFLITDFGLEDRISEPGGQRYV